MARARNWDRARRENRAAALAREERLEALAREERLDRPAKPKRAKRKNRDRAVGPRNAPDADTLSLRVTCPVCLAAPGLACESQQGVHWSRLQAARRGRGP